MKIKPNGFTLVELIVIITILAILGTIAFISIQWYAQNARNSIRINHIWKLASSIDNQKISGANLLWLSFTGSEVENAQIGGTGAIIGKNYKAGNYNEFALKIQSDQFRDPLTSDMYKVGVTSQKNGSFEVAGTIENGSWENPKVVGSYTPRVQDFAAWKSSTGSYRITLEGYDKIGSFFPGDVLVGSLVSPNTTIQSISRDGTVFVLNSATIAWNGDIALASNEVAWLIRGVGWSAVVDLWNDVPYSVSSSTSWGGSSSAGAVDWPSWAVPPLITWTATTSDSDIYLPDSNSYNNFTTDAAANNTNIIIEIGNQNTTIDTRWGNDNITTWYGNSDIDISGGNNTINIGDGFNEIFMGSNGNNTLNMWNGDNEIQTDGGDITVIWWGWNNQFSLWYGNNIDITLGHGDNTINGISGGNFKIVLWNGNNTISPGGFWNHDITLGNGSNSLTGVWGSSIVTTGTGGTADITFGWNQAQKLVWRWGNVTVNDYWRWGNNRVSFENISDINNCTDVSNNTAMSWSQATITSAQWILIIHIQESHTHLNCSTNMIF